MTEAAQVFNQTVGERSKQKNSAHHKKNGSAVTKLGNKPMSWKEIAEKHGECVSFDLAGFPTFDEFSKFPVDLRVEYVNKLMDKYDIELQHISLYLFHKGADGLKSHLRNQRMNDDRALKFCDYQKPRAKSGLLKFQADIEEWRRREKLTKEIDEAEAQRKRDIIWNAEFITYDEFKELPLDGQVTYVNNMIKKYNVSIGAISQILFEQNRTVLRDYFVAHKLDKSINVGSSPKGCAARISNQKFQKLVDSWRGVTVMEEIPSEIVEEKIETVPEVEINVESAVVEDPAIELVDIPQEYETPDVDVPFKAHIEEKKICGATFKAMVYDNNPGMLKEAEIAEAAEDVAPEGVTIDELLIPGKLEIAPAQEQMSFSTNYISETGLDEHQLYALISLFQGKKVSVKIDIQVV